MRGALSEVSCKMPGMVNCMVCIPSGVRNCVEVSYHGVVVAVADAKRYHTGAATV